MSHQLIVAPNDAFVVWSTVVDDVVYYNITDPADYTASGNLVTSKTMVIADSNGSTLSGGDERGINLRSKRISWRELMGQ